MTNHKDSPAPLFHALADPTRSAVVARLAEGPASAGDLVSPFRMALPTFLQHLKVLEAAGLIVTQKAGRTRVCRISPAGIARAEGWLAAQRAKWQAQTDRLQDFLELGHDLADGPQITKETRDERA